MTTTANRWAEQEQVDRRRGPMDRPPTEPWTTWQDDV